MYYLMNKDKVVASFEEKPASAFSYDIVFIVSEISGMLPLGFDDINSWIDGRKSSKHNTRMRCLMRQIDCDNRVGFIRATHAATLNDTFWIKADSESISWEDVSLYSNRFSTTISRASFENERVIVNNSVLSLVSPELSCEGSFPKCFRRESVSGQFDSDIFIYKRGTELGLNLEPYCEMLASEVASIICGNNSVNYSIEQFCNNPASKCNLFTNEHIGYVSFSKIKNKNYTLQDIFDYFVAIGSEQQFREMLIVDSLCFNQDRHMSNYGVLFNNDTLEIIGMAPVYDYNLSFLSRASIEDFECIGDRLFGIQPKLGEDFTRIGQMAVNDSLRDRVKSLQDFSFSFRGDDVFTSSRVETLEIMVRKQVKAVLSDKILHTIDVFPPSFGVSDF